MEFAVVLVTYNPNLDRLRQSIVSMRMVHNITYIIIVDNGSQNIDSIRVCCNVFAINLIHNKNNEGIGSALNRGFHIVPSRYKWILSLDQDSIVPKNIGSEYSKYTHMQNLAIISPKIVDKRRFNRNETLESFPYQYINQCIQSGSLYRRSVWEKMGGFNAWLFIDYVDFDYCFRIMKRHWKILRVNNVELNQEFGELTDSQYKNVFNVLWQTTHISFFKKLTYVPNIKPWRMYYRTRNRIYCFKYLNKFQVLLEILRLPLFYLKVLFRSHEKLKVLHQLLRGTRDGFREWGGTH